MEFTLVTSEKADSQHSSPQHCPERGQQSWGSPAEMSWIPNDPQSCYLCTFFSVSLETFLAASPSFPPPLSMLPMTQASPSMVPISLFWAVSQHMLRISQMCSWFTCYWFGPHCFSLIKLPNLHSFVRAVWNLLGLKYARTGDRTELAESVSEDK